MASAVISEDLADLRDEWLTLLDSGTAAKIFQHPTWQQAWLEEFAGDREPLFLSIREDGDLLAIAPLMRENARLTFLGDPSICDYLDLVFAPGQEERALSLLMGWLLEEEWDEIELPGLRATSPTLAHLPDIARSLRLRVSVELEAVCPQIELPSAWETYLSQLTKHNRHELRRKVRRLYNDVLDVQLRRLAGRDEVASGMDVFLNLMCMRSDKARFMTDEMERFFRSAGAVLADEGLAVLYVLDVDGKSVASAFCFEDADDLLLYNSGYDPSLSRLAVGLLSKALLLQQAIESGKRRFDFLRGSEPYKYDLGGKDLQVYRCLIKRP